MLSLSWAVTHTPAPVASITSVRAPASHTAKIGIPVCRYS
jgi:hypothetical protein